MIEAPSDHSLCRKLAAILALASLLGLSACKDRQPAGKAAAPPSGTASKPAQATGKPAGKANKKPRPCQPKGPVGGKLTKDTTWCGMVKVDRNILVPKGVTLTLEPGTKLHFKAYRGYKEPQRRLRMRVDGKLHAVGRPGAMIFFTTDAKDARNGDWSMIKLVSAAGSRIAYCVFEFAQHGLNIWNTDIDLEGLVVRFNNWEGLYAENNCTVKLSKSRIYSNGYNCIAVEQYVKLEVRSSYIANCGTLGLHLDASEALVQGNLFEGSQEAVSLDNDAKVKVLTNRFTGQKNAAITCGGGKNKVILGPNEYEGYPMDLAVDCSDDDITEVKAEGTPPATLSTGAREGLGPYLDYIPGERPHDNYPYVFSEKDETREVVRKVGGHIGLTWSLAWDGKHLWTANLDGLILRLDPVKGQVLQKFRGPGPQPWGMAHDGKHLWVVDFARRQIHALNPKTGKVRRKFASPDPKGGCKGLAHDGEHLYALGWATHALYRLSPTGEVLASVPAPYRELGGGVKLYAAGGLTWDGEAFWAPADRLMKFDRKGKLLGWIHSTSERVWDMTWDGEALWTTLRANENWSDYPRLFRIKVLKLRTD